MDAILNALRLHLQAQDPVALATVVELAPQQVDGAGAEPDERGSPALGRTMLVRSDDAVVGSLGNPDLDGAVARDAVGLIDAGAAALRRYGPSGQIGMQSVSVFLQAFAPQPRLIIFGAIDFSAALASMAKLLGFRVTICDARSVFATGARFPMADEVTVDLPDRYLANVGPELGGRDVVCVLTHDPKFDVPAIMGALATSVGYIGAMGSRRTTVDRAARLHEAGATDEDLARVMAPIGLDIGARTPAETAISICAEIVSVRSGGGIGASLRDKSGPIHKMVPR